MNFFDTNVIVYAISGAEKQFQARETLAQGGVISVQVLNEMINVLRGKLRQDWSLVQRAHDYVLALFPDPLPLTLEMHETAFAIARDHGVHIYDAQIIAAAQQAGCSILYSEDLQHGRRFGGVEIVNPFL